jgi:hypothetical protein
MKHEPPIEPVARLRKAVRGFYAWLGAMALVAIAPVLAGALIHAGSWAGRVGGVALGTTAWIPLIAVISATIRAGDEFQRRTHLVALAVAYAGSFVLIGLLHWLVRAAFLSQPPLPVLWLGFVSLWFVSLVLASRHFERNP